MADPNTVGAPAQTGNTATATPLRLQLDPNRPAEPYLDGAWWPRSTELRAELPALLVELSAQLGSIALVGYHRDAWNAAPGDLDLAGHPVHLQGFVSPTPPTLVVIADTGQRVTLRVVPPETDGASASQAMTAATNRAAQATHRWSSHRGRRRRDGHPGRAHGAAVPAARQHRPRAGRPDLQVGRRSRRPVQQRTDPGVRPDPRRAHRPRTPIRHPRRSGRSPPH